MRNYRILHIPTGRYLISFSALNSANLYIDFLVDSPLGSVHRIGNDINLPILREELEIVYG